MENDFEALIVALQRKSSISPKDSEIVVEVWNQRLNNNQAETTQKKHLTNQLQCAILSQENNTLSTAKKG